MEMWEECAGRQYLRLAFGFRSIPGAGGSERATHTAPRAPPFRRSCSAILSEQKRQFGSRVKMNLAFLGTIGVLFIIFAPGIVSVFGGTGEASAYAIDCLRIVSAGFFFYPYGMVLTAAFNGAGAVWTPTIINLFCFWLWEIPLAWLLAFPLGVGPNEVFTAIMIAFSTLTIVSGTLFKRGKWKEASV